MPSDESAAGHQEAAKATGALYGVLPEPGGRRFLVLDGEGGPELPWVEAEQPYLPQDVIDRAVDVVERPEPAEHTESDGGRPGQQEEAEERDEPGVEGAAEQVREQPDREQRQARRDDREQGEQAGHRWKPNAAVGGEGLPAAVDWEGT